MAMISPVSSKCRCESGSFEAKSAMKYTRLPRFTPTIVYFTSFLALIRSTFADLHHIGPVKGFLTGEATTCVAGSEFVDVSLHDFREGESMFIK